MNALAGSGLERGRLEHGRLSDSRLQQRLIKQLCQASIDHALIEPGDRILVAVSGGKDSLGLLHLLRAAQSRIPFEFSILAVNVDQGQPGFPTEVLPSYFAREGYEYKIITEDTYSVVTEKIPEGKTYCSLCSRLRRGILYSAATRLGATKIALGHHRDDAIITLLLNIFYAGKIAAMPAKLSAKGGAHTVIRPLLYCAEDDLRALSVERAFPIIPCNLCGSQKNLKRAQMKELLAKLSLENPKVPGNLFAALSNVLPAHLLDPKLAGGLATEEDSDGESAPTSPVRSLPLLGATRLLR
ncbi:MAG TPA: tRNA 2-thiocytidine(32) synthetase TtcA [Polyangiaceae bacterium]|nr:tRNA 2-thiocytidine(32) synthetase TtcA [Polyangiaceae bacterium]